MSFSPDLRLLHPRPVNASSIFNIQPLQTLNFFYSELKVALLTIV
jgi:hypothetical protein